MSCGARVIRKFPIQRLTYDRNPCKDKLEWQSERFGSLPCAVSWDFNVACNNRLFPAMIEQAPSVIVSTLGKRITKLFKKINNHPSRAHGLCAAGSHCYCCQLEAFLLSALSPFNGKP